MRWSWAAKLSLWERDTTCANYCIPIRPTMQRRYKDREIASRASRRVISSIRPPPDDHLTPTKDSFYHFNNEIIRRRPNRKIEAAFPPLVPGCLAEEGIFYRRNKPMNINGLRARFLISNDPRDFNKPASSPRWMSWWIRYLASSDERPLRSSGHRSSRNPTVSNVRKEIVTQWMREFRVAENWFVLSDGKL